MSSVKIFLMLGLGLIVSACTDIGVSTSNPVKNNALTQAPSEPVTAPKGYLTSSSVADEKSINEAEKLLVATPLRSLVTVNSVVVHVPRSLEVSEANRLFPTGDIIWREDPIGDRHAQVQKIFTNAMTKGVAKLDGPVKVDVDIRVLRFHALTNMARYTTGGVHSITFKLSVKDPKTGVLLLPVRWVRADLEAFGGRRAVRADARGQTQKVRISDHLGYVLRQELNSPDGHQNASLGFYQILNNM